MYRTQTGGTKSTARALVHTGTGMLTLRMKLSHAREIGRIAPSLKIPNIDL